VNYLIARVSDPDQRKALPAQKKKIFDYAKKEGWLEGKDFTYIEFDETAFKENRVKFQDAVINPLLKAQELVICVFDKIDRFSRDSSSEEKSILMKLLKAGAIEMHFPSDNLYMHKGSPAADWFRLDIGVSLASYYSAAIRDNVKRRYDQMLADGIWVGKAPIGYQNYVKRYDENGKPLEKGIKVDEVRSPLIKEAFELRSTGLPYRSIVKQLNKKGLNNNTKKKRPLSTSQLEKILENPFYIGTMQFMGKSYRHHYDTFIEQWLWDKVQEVKLSRGKGRTAYNSKPFLFKTLKCKQCGYSISFDGPKNGGNIYGRCTEYGGKHGARLVNEKLLLEQVRAAFKSVKVPPSLMPTLIAELDKNHASEQKHYISNKNRLQKEYDSLDEEVQELYKDRKQFKSRPDIFEKMVKDIENKQKTILDDLEDHSNGDKAFVIGASYILDVCSRADELFDAEGTELAQKRYLISFVLTNMTLDGEKLDFTLVEPFNAIADLVKSANWCPGLDSNQRP
jgi:site-specific DNA recombinase